jgi:peptidoglycan-associated lipoprotein
LEDKKMKKLLVIAAMTAFVFGACSQKDANTGSTTSAKDVYGARGSDAGQADSANITTTGKAILKANAEWLKANTNVKVQIEGHCDSRGTIEYNIALGERRAISVKNYLAGLGVKKENMSTISYGEERPLDGAETEAAWAKNRRGNFVVVQK